MTIRDLLAQQNSGALFCPERFDAVFDGPDIRFWRLGHVLKAASQCGHFHRADVMPTTSGFTGVVGSATLLRSALLGQR